MTRKTNTRRRLAKVSLDFKNLSLPDSVKTVQDLLVHVQSAVLPKNRVLQEVLLDGEILTEEAEKDSHTLKLADFENVDLHSRRTVELAVEGLENAQDVLPAVALDLVAAAGDLRTDNLERGLALLHDCLAMIDWYLDLTGAIESLFHEESPWLRHRGEEKEDGLARERGTFRTFETKEDLMAQLRELEQVETAADFVALADLVEYGIARIVAIWAEELPAIFAKMKAETAEA